MSLHQINKQLCRIEIVRSATNRANSLCIAFLRDWREHGAPNNVFAVKVVIMPPKSGKPPAGNKSLAAYMDTFTAKTLDEARAAYPGVDISVEQVP